MRENMGLYRGKTTQKHAGHEFNEIWVYGDLLRSGDRFFIHPWANAFQTDHELTKLVVVHEVDPSTVGQDTGLTDKNGKRIFEGDIVRHYNDTSNPDIFSVAAIFWEKTKCTFMRTSGHNDPFCISAACIYEVIGNIHDNPELLERGRPD